MKYVLMLANLGFSIAAGILTRLIPQLILGSHNEGELGYSSNFLVALLLTLLTNWKLGFDRSGWVYAGAMCFIICRALEEREKP